MKTKSRPKRQGEQTAKQTRRRTFELYRDRNKEWRWRLRASNGKIVADSGEGYEGKAVALRAVHRHKKAVADAKVIFVEGPHR